MSVRIPIEQLTLPPAITAGMNPGVVMSLWHFLRTSRGDVEPILVRREGRRLYSITDGRHRFVASVMAGRDSVLADVEGEP